MSEKRRVNGLIIRVWTVLIAIIMAAYTLELVKGERTLKYMAVFSLFAVLPPVFAWVLYTKNPENRILNYIAGYSYMVFYAFVLITADTNMVFVYALPVAIVLMVCSEVRMFTIFSLVCVGANILKVAYSCIVLHQTSPDYIADYEIQVLSIGFCLVAAILTMRTLGKINHDKLQHILEQEKMQERTANTVLNVSQEVQVCVEQISDSMHDMLNDTTATLDSMRQITEGTAQTADSIQIQMERTNIIQENINDTVQIADSIYELSSQAIEDVRIGIENMEKLSRNTEIVNRNKEQVYVEMNALEERTKNAMECVFLIQEITSQTNLLALNASIEAARAGEMGRGFAVVAEEITELAAKTKESTEEIEKLIQELKQEAERATDTVNAMAEASDQQNEVIRQTEQYLESISAVVEEVYGKSKKQAEQIQEINHSNSEIVTNIHTISAASEEVTANTQQTCEISENNRNHVEFMQKKVNELTGHMDRLAELKNSK